MTTQLLSPVIGSDVRVTDQTSTRRLRIVDVADFEQHPATPLQTPVRHSDHHCIAFTSGTTGPSKGVLSSHCHVVSFSLDWIKLNHFGEHDVTYCPMPLFHALGQPLLLGASRKRMIGALSNEAPVEQRLGGSIALAVAGMNAGVQLLRVHDVAPTVQARNVWRGLRDAALTDFSALPML